MLSLNACRKNREGCKRSVGARSLPVPGRGASRPVRVLPGGMRSIPQGCAPQATDEVAQCPVEVQRTSEGVEGCAAARRGYQRNAHKHYGATVARSLKGGK